METIVRKQIEIFSGCAALAKMAIPKESDVSAFAKLASQSLNAHRNDFPDFCEGITGTDPVWHVDEFLQTVWHTARSQLK